MNAPALLIFDLDGTLYCTESSFVPTVKRLFDGYGLQSPPVDEILSMVGETFTTVLERIRDLGIDEGLPALAARIAEIELASIAEIGRLFGDVAETLARLASAGHPLAICTNGDQAYTGTILRKFGIDGLFSIIATHEDAKETKDEMISKLRAAYPGRPAVVIGDRYHDIVAGRANDCVVIGAGYGYARPGELDDVDHRIERLDELPGLLAAL